MTKTKNILKMYRQASEFEKEYGNNWYNKANMLVRNLAIEYDLPIKIVAGVLAILSPRNRWERNVIDCKTIVKAYNEHKGIDSFKVSTLDSNKRKAWLLLHTRDMKLIKGIKVSNFYLNILGSKNNVTIDTHAYNIAIGKHRGVKTFTYTQYDDVAIAYQSVASMLGIAPCDLQAITWLTYKRVYNIACDWKLYQGRLF